MLDDDVRPTSVERSMFGWDVEEECEESRRLALFDFAARSLELDRLPFLFTSVY